MSKDLVTAVKTELLSDPDMLFLGFEVQARVTESSGCAVAECTARAFRRKRNRRALDVDEIVYELDSIDASLSDLVNLLAEVDAPALDAHFNSEGLVIAERIEVSDQYRGTKLWKDLLARALEEAVKVSSTRPSHYYLKAFPLSFEQAGNCKHEESFRREARKLRLLYGMHLGAEVIAEWNGAYFMRCPLRSEVA